MHGPAGSLARRVRTRIVAWARGYPLALTVAASAPGGRLGAPLEAHLKKRLTAWRGGRPMLDVDREVLEVAAIARIVDGRLLAAALPGRNTRDLLPRLRALPITEALGAGASMHPVLADAIRDRLKTMAPNRYRQLVRRIAEHLATRARLGDMDALIELSLLIEDPVYRRPIGNEPSRSCYPDRPRPGEFEDFGRQHGYDQGPDWAELSAWRRSGTADFRPRGAVGFVEAIVLAEQGFKPRGPGNADLLADTNDPERAARLRKVLDVVFGDTPEDRRLRAILGAVHLGPRRSEASLLAEFHVGRTTWYRLLRIARERVLAHR